MAEDAKSINPEIDLRVMDEPVASANVDQFLSGVDVLVDGIDLFAFDARRHVSGRPIRRVFHWLDAAGNAFPLLWSLLRRLSHGPRAFRGTGLPIV